MHTTDDTTIPSSISGLDPDRWFTPRIGSDGALLERRAIRHWLEQFTRAHPYVAMQTIGESTEGRSLDMVVISDELRHRSLDDLETERQAIVGELLRGGTPTGTSRPVVLVTSGIHATEIGGPQGIPELVWWLGTSPEAATVRQRVTTLIVPTLNPDGFDLVTRWHRQTLGTDAQGTKPPLLYHRFAGHDNNRDWLFRNLAETRVVLDRIHGAWLPHVTLDQHQMNPHGPRFVLPPYADPWEAHIHPHIIAASNALGQAIATDMTLAGLRGVVTGRYFDAWEPSRALQHYRGGIRILAEAASASLAHPIEIDATQLATDPMPQPITPSGDGPAPWPGGTWRLRDIIDYHLTAARSLLTRVAAEPRCWSAVQQTSLVPRPEGTRFTIPTAIGAIDRAANRRLASIIDAAGATRDDTSGPAWATQQPMGPLLDALLRPKPYPAAHGTTAYDVTTHHLPMILGATVSVADRVPDLPAPDLSGRYLLVDARCHAASEVIEPVLRHDPPAVWRTTARAMSSGQLVEPGTWVIDRDGHPQEHRLAEIAHGSITLIPGGAASIIRRDVLLMDIADEQSEDHGWTRLWLHRRSIPFLEAEFRHGPPMNGTAPTTTILIADTSRASVDASAIQHVGTLIDAGATVLAFGASGRLLAETLVTGVGLPDPARSGPVNAPGALVRLQPRPGTELALGLDRSLPVMFQRDGAFTVSRSARDVEVVARYAAHDPVVSGWMSSTDSIRNAPAALRVRHGRGTLYAFAFRPLFRGQTLVASPLVHNLLYLLQEPSSCPPSDAAKRPAGTRSGRMS